MFFYITVQRDGHAELVSASHREPLLFPVLGQILKQVQDDFGRFLLFLHSFWGSQFNTYVLLSKNIIRVPSKFFTKP